MTPLNASRGLFAPVEIVPRDTTDLTALLHDTDELLANAALMFNEESK